MKRISPIFISFFLLISIYSFSQRDAAVIDSLKNLLETTHKDDTLRLSVLRKLALSEQNTEWGLELANELIAEAKRLKSAEHYIYGNYYTLIYYYNRQNFDEVERYTQFIIPLAEKEKVWLVYFEALKISIYCSYVKEEFELGLYNAEIMLKKATEVNNVQGIIQANICLGMAYSGSERFDEAITVLQEARKRIEDKNSINSIDVLSVLINCYSSKKDYTNMYHYLNEYVKSIDNYLEKYPYYDIINSYYAMANIYYGYYYLDKKNPDKAWSYFAKAEQLLKDGFILYKIHFHRAVSEYYVYLKDYRNALLHLDSSLNIVRDIVPRDYYEQTAMKADILMKMGNIEKALPLYKRAIYGKDSLNQAVSNKQLIQYRKIYNKNQCRIEREKLRNDRQRILLIFIGIILLMLLAFTIRTIVVRRKLSDAEKQMKDATLLANEANEIKDRFLSNLSYSIRTPLNSVVGFSQLISDEPNMDKEVQKEYGMIIKKSSEELIHLVNNVLDLSRLEAGMMKFSPGKYSIDELFTTLKYIIKSQYGDQIVLTINNYAKCFEIFTDSKKFIQALVSMFTVPAIDGDKRKITITIDKINSSDNLTITVSGTLLATGISQIIIIQNEINRLFVEHFGGTYHFFPEDCTIVFTYPISN